MHRNSCAFLRSRTVRQMLSRWCMNCSSGFDLTWERVVTSAERMLDLLMFADQPQGVRLEPTIGLEPMTCRLRITARFRSWKR